MNSGPRNEDIHSDEEAACVDGCLLFIEAISSVTDFGFVHQCWYLGEEHARLPDDMITGLQRGFRWRSCRIVCQAG
jgi:hypothetical protein